MYTLQVESSTIPLNRLSLVANISISRHGELNSRASCPSLRTNSSSENPVPNKTTTKLGGASSLVSDRVLTSSHTQWIPDLSADYEVLPTFLNSTMELPTHSTTSIPVASNIWEENFQDLSSYCQDPELSSLTKDMSTGKENLIGPPDDELNTPEIGYDEFNFGSWSKPEPTEDNYLWDENPLGKIGSDHYDEGSMFADYNNCDLPDETNTGLVSLYYTSEETVVQETTRCISPVMADSDDANCTKLANEETTFKGQIIATEADEMPNLYHLETTKPSNSTVTAEVDEMPNLYHLDTSKSLVSTAPQMDSGCVSVQELPSGVKLTLPLTAFENSIVLNTPDVLDTLDHQPEFNILNYVLEETTNETNTTHENSNDDRTSNIAVKKETDDVPQASESVDINSEEDIVASSSTDKDQSGESHMVVFPSLSNGSVRILIKKHPGTKAKGSRQTQKRERKVSEEYIVVHKSHDSSSDEEYLPPVKRKKRSASCSSKATDSGCSRYRELRDRNNEASRKSRLNRKAREEEMKIQAAELEAENQKLKIRAEELEKLVDTLRKALLTAMVKAKD